MASLVESVAEGAPHRVISVEDAVGRLQEAVEQTVSRSAIPQRVETTAQAGRQLQRPIDHAGVQLDLDVCGA